MRRRMMLCQNNQDGYVEDGLILRLDGINNTRNGHNESSILWEDLSGNDYDWYFGYGTPVFDENSLSLSGSSDVRNANNVSDIFGTTRANGYTIEVCFKRNNLNDFVLYHSGQASNIRKCYGWENGWHGNFYEAGVDGYNTTNKVSISVQYLNECRARFNSEFGNRYNHSGWNYTGSEAIIGSRYGYFMNGHIYSFRVYNRTLTDAEMLNNYAIDRERFNF